MNLFKISKVFFMRFTLIFTLSYVVLSIASAEDVLSQVKKETGIEFSMNKVSVVSVIEVISRETGYKFIYDEALLMQKGHITVRLKNASLQEALQQVSNKTGLTFRKQDDDTWLISGVSVTPVPEKNSTVQQQYCDGKSTFALLWNGSRRVCRKGVPEHCRQD